MIYSATPDVSRNASPFLYGQEWDAASQVLHSGQYGHTDVTEQFEQDVAQFLGVPDTIAVATGTTALHLSLLAAGVGPGHEVIVPSMTFCASIQAILACGATPLFIEVDPDTLCIRNEDVVDAITPSTRAVMPVLFGGRAVDLGDIHTSLTELGITIVEDAAHAFGSYSHTTRVGAAGLLTCFSFGPIKNLTCGQGGMIVPRSPHEAHGLRILRGLGIVESPAERSATTSYTVEGFGFRAQMPAMNAAIGGVQLANFAQSVERRKELWRVYEEALADLDEVSLVDVDVVASVPSLCVVRVPDRDRVFEFLRSRGIGAGVHYPPNHLQPAFARWHRPLPETETAGGEVLSLPFHQHMSDKDARDVVSVLDQALTAAESQR